MGSKSAVKPRGVEVFAAGVINLLQCCQAVRGEGRAGSKEECSCQQSVRGEVFAAERVMTWDVDRDDAMDSGEGWVPVTVGSSKCLFPNTRYNNEV